MYDRPGCCVAAWQAENFVPKRDNAPKNEANLVGDTTVFIEEIPVQKSPQIDPEKCTGYLQREMAYSHEDTGTISPSNSRIKVFDFEHEGRKVSYTCTQCAEAWCVNACLVWLTTWQMW